MVLALRVNDRRVCALRDHLSTLLARNVTCRLLAPLVYLVSSLLRWPDAQMIAA